MEQANRWGQDHTPQEEFIGDGVRSKDSNAAMHSDEGNGSASESMIIGAIAGAIAVIPMTIVMMKTQKRLKGYSRPLPPEEVTESLLHKADLDSEIPYSSKRFDFLFAANHFGYGATLGALYPLFSRLLPQTKPIVKGPLYGFLVWLDSYAGWIPIFKVLRKEKALSRKNNAALISSHLVWGAILAALADRRVRR